MQLLYILSKMSICTSVGVSVSLHVALRLTSEPSRVTSKLHPTLLVLPNGVTNVKLLFSHSSVSISFVDRRYIYTSKNVSVHAVDSGHVIKLGSVVEETIGLVWDEITINHWRQFQKVHDYTCGEDTLKLKKKAKTTTLNTTVYVSLPGGLTVFQEEKEHINFSRQGEPNWVGHLQTGYHQVNVTPQTTNLTGDLQGHKDVHTSCRVQTVEVPVTIQC